MSLSPGTRIGAYEVVAPLGAGGMGEVYRARDLKLGREVAIKMLPDAVASDPDRLSRFEREAKTLASLNHPHIAQIYGFEQADGASALVMELVEGEDLSRRLARGPIPVAEALPMARQIAAALEAAHEQGIVHRDLKPGNIKIRRDDTVKVLDFGLAKAIEPASATNNVESPTVTSPAMTAAGMILGTAAYMSPEQARGLHVDKRADVWAFGVVLFEMLSGVRLFDGPTVSDSLAAVLTREPDWSQLPKATPPRVVELIGRCLRKDPKRRLRDIGDAAFELDDAQSPSSSIAFAATPPLPPRTASMLPWMIAVAASVIAVGAFLWGARARQPSTAPLPARVTLTLPADATMFLSRGSSVAVSPDGSRIVFTGTVKQRTQLYVRRIDVAESTPLPGTDDAVNPFFSSDGQWVGFSAERKLKKVNLQGGTVVTLSDASNLRGETWAPDDSIIFSPSNASALMRVRADGKSSAEPYTTLATGEFSHRWPQVIPGRDAIVFTIWNDTGFEGGRIAVQRLDGSDRKVLVQGGSYGRIVIDGARAFLVYSQADGLLAAPFDLDRLELAGAVTSIGEGVLANLSGGAHYAFSNNGLLAYLPGSVAEAAKDLLWVDRTGKETTAAEIPDLSVLIGVTADGRRLVRLNSQGPNRDVFVHDLTNGNSKRLTSGGFHGRPLFVPDGRRVIYSAGLPDLNIFWRAADGSGEEERLATSANAQFASSVSPDGKTLAYVEFDPVSAADIWLLSLEGDHAAKPFLQSKFSEGDPDISPDGRWIAYQSNESGRFNIYVTSFPNPGPSVQVTSAGGIMPKWSGDGREVFYRNDDRIMAVPLTIGTQVKAGDATMLFRGAYLSELNIAQQTGQFLLIRDNGQEAAGKTINLVMNWFGDLRAKLPLK